MRAETTREGRPVIAVGMQGGAMYVATTGPAYPVLSEGGGTKTRFTDWNVPFTVIAPEGAIEPPKRR
jgi:hypothetical protein